MALSLQTVGLTILVGAQETWQLFGYAAIFGTGFGALRPLSGALPADYFGRRAYGAIRGAMSSIQVGGSMIAPVLTGWIADSMGTYSTAFLVMAALNTVGIVTALLLRPPRIATIRS